MMKKKLNYNKTTTLKLFMTTPMMIGAGFAALECVNGNEL